MTERRYVGLRSIWYIPQNGERVYYRGEEGEVVDFVRYTSLFTGPNTAVVKIKMFGDDGFHEVLASSLAKEVIE